jgi:hypothetical protein
VVVVRRGIALVVIVFVLLFALLGWGYLTFIQAHPRGPTQAERMVLRPGDIGPEWQLMIGVENQGSFANISSGYEVEMTNTSVDIGARVFVFNTVVDCEVAYRSLLNVLSNGSVGNYTVLPSHFGDRSATVAGIGEEGVLIQQGKILMNTWVMNMDGGSIQPQWIHDACLLYSGIQFQKSMAVGAS